MSKLVFNEPTIGSIGDPFEVSFQLHESTLTFFKQTATGPEVMGDDYLPFVTENPDAYSDLYKIGSFYCVAVGQGMYYNTGLFGPLPVLGSKYRAMVFSTTVKDNKTFDSRMKGWNYLVACFFFHESMLPVIHEKRELIEDIFESFFAKNEKLATIKNQTIQKLKQEIMLLLQD